MAVSTNPKRTGLSDGATVLAQSGVAVTSTGTTADVTLASITIPGGSMGPNGAIRVRALFSCSATASAKFMRAKFAGNLVLDIGNGDAGYRSLPVDFMFYNRGSASSQVSQAFAAFNNGLVYPTTAVDTSQDQVLTLIMATGDAAATVALEAYTVELIAG